MFIKQVFPKFRRPILLVVISDISDFKFLDTDANKLLSPDEISAYVDDYLRFNSKLMLFCVPKTFIKYLSRCVNSLAVVNFMEYLYTDMPFYTFKHGVLFGGSGFINFSLTSEEESELKMRMIKLRIINGVVD